MADTDTGSPVAKTEDPGKVTDTKNETPEIQDARKPKEGEKTFDESVFDNPKLWEHPRFKSLNERAKRATELEKSIADADEKRLADQKKFEELASKRAQERDEIANKYTSSLQDNRIITEASKVGVVDIDTILKLVDRSKITVDQNGNVSGVIEAVNDLVTAKPFLKGSSNVTIGSPTNPGAETNSGTMKFKLSQLSNPDFYREHEKDILNAYKAGQIEDDISK
jgi:hypothetical protein